MRRLAAAAGEETPARPERWFEEGMAANLVAGVDGTERLGVIGMYFEAKPCSESAVLVCGATPLGRDVQTSDSHLRARVRPAHV